jgi:putative peptide zinc metalloprotease protein
VIPGLAAPPLPRLREELRLQPSRPDVNGQPVWTLHDPLAETFFQMDLAAFQLLSLWPRHATAHELGAAAAERYERVVGLDEIEALRRFLETNRLTVEPAGGWRGLAEAEAKRASSPLAWLLHNYLFMKIPLVRPAGFLKATLPIARLLVSTPALALIIFLSAVGLLLALRRWGEFAGTFTDFLTPQGAMSFAATLLALKLLHELGHAYVATAKGCRVSSMGVAFMLGAPMAYTDVTDAWRLPRRRDRMAIDIAGVSVELAVAGLATFAWVLLPDGDMRAVAFVFATMGWVISLAVNLNPFMRFDGYFILADWLNIPNLQSRAFALSRWRLRLLLFGAAEPEPDSLPDLLRRFAICYGFAVWIYRLILFTGIALVVYHMFFKALGILLFAIEIAVFILLPIWRELRHWWQHRARYASNRRSLATAAALVALIAAAAIPWQTTVEAPAILEPVSFQRVFPRTPGDILRIEVKIGDRVRAGDTLLVLASPKLESEALKIAVRLTHVEERLGRRIADRKDLGSTAQLEQERATLLERRQAIAREVAELVIRAPIEGVVRELAPALHAGRTLGRQEEIALIAADAGQVVRGYATADDALRLAAGNRGVFIPEDPQIGRVAVSLSEVATSGVKNIEIASLASALGGKVESWPQGKTGELAPVHASHLITLAAASAGEQAQVLRGMVRLEATAESLAARAARQALRVLMRESGF